MEETEFIANESILKAEPDQDVRSIIFCPIAFILAFIFVNVVYDSYISIFMTLISMGILVTARIYLKKHDYEMNKTTNIMFITLMVFCLSYSYTANAFINILVTIFEAIGLCLFIFTVCHGEGLSDFTLFHQLRASIGIYRKRKMLRSAKALHQLISCTNAKNIVYGLCGLCFSIPLTIVVAYLLGSADSRINALISNLFTFNKIDFTTIFFKCVFTIVVGINIYAILLNNSADKLNTAVTDEIVREKLSRKKLLPVAALSVSIIPVCLLYILFFFSQAEYLLAAFSGRLPGDFIYSEYARQGFFELCAIAVINLAIIVIFNVMVKEDNTHKIIKLSSVFLCLATLFIIATALRKMFLYIEMYGLTEQRLNTSWFMLLLAAIFIIIMIWVLKKQKSIKIFKIIFITFTVWFGIYVFSMPHRIIATYNISMFEAGELNFLDKVELLDLSPDAWRVLQGSEYYDENDKAYLEKQLTHPEYGLNLSVMISRAKLK